ncbi:MAG TPA: hypothetical protein VFJ97_04970 [Dermatophilaceae bacterium]|nr:hypothetical protein [Dermatophilaceae bacterium]
MQPSSLIFLAIIAIWAVPLLQHWVRRREHLATARSVDRFSEAMRVLERRHTPTEGAEPRSYLVSPARPSRPEVVVKRAVAVAPAASSAPARKPRSAARRPGVRPTPLFRAIGTLNGITARRLRALSLLACLLAVPTLLVLGHLGRLPWYASGVAGGALLLDLLVLRASARRSRGARRARVTAARAAAVSATHARTGTPRPAEPAVKATEVATAEQIGWQPVPVPPPTYTLKAKVERPAHRETVVDDLDLEDTQEMPVMADDVADLVDAEELDELLERRSVAGA